jgi:hypothetical protein
VLLQDFRNNHRHLPVVAFGRLCSNPVGSPHSSPVLWAFQNKPITSGVLPSMGFGMAGRSICFKGVERPPASMAVGRHEVS